MDRTRREGAEIKIKKDRARERWGGAERMLWVF